MSTIWPVQVPGMKQGTQSWCSGTTQRDRVGIEEGGGGQDGETHVYQWLIRVNVCQKPPRYCKVISLQFKKKLTKKKKSQL